MATKKAKPAAIVALDFHYYGSTAYDWVVGLSREYVVKRLASYYTSMYAAAKKRGSGIECVVCKVLLPQSAYYTIRNFVPNAIITGEGENKVTTDKRVPLREYERLLLLDAKGKAIPNADMPPNPTDEELAADDDKPVVNNPW